MKTVKKVPRVAILAVALLASLLSCGDPAPDPATQPPLMRPWAG